MKRIKIFILAYLIFHIFACRNELGERDFIGLTSWCIPTGITAPLPLGDIVSSEPTCSTSSKDQINALLDKLPTLKLENNVKDINMETVYYQADLVGSDNRTYRLRSNGSHITFLNEVYRHDTGVNKILCECKFD